MEARRGACADPAAAFQVRQKRAARWRFQCKCADKQGFHSTEQMMPIGMKGKLVAFTRKNNRFYSCLKDITIQTNTVKAAFYDMNLTEVTPDAFIKVIKLLDE